MGQKLLRQSLIGSADICLRRAGYDLDPQYPASGTSEASVIGTGYHGGLETYYRGRWDGTIDHQPTAREMTRIFEAAEVAFEEAKVEYGTDWEWDTSEIDALATVRRALEAYFAAGHQWEIGPDARYEVRGVEETFEFDLSDLWKAHGTIDLVLWDRVEMNHVLVDHKTSGRAWPKNKDTPRKNNQATYYTWAWQHLHGGPLPRFVFDVMRRDGKKFERRWSPRQGHEIHYLLAKARRYIDLLDSLPVDALPPTTDHNLCSEKYCNYWQVCPFGEALETGVEFGATGA